MAILAPNGQDPNDPNNNQANTGGGGTVMNSTPSSGGNAPGTSAGGAGAASNGASNTAARPTNPSGTPNVNDYLNANQGAGQKLASGITSNVQNQANQVSNQVNTSQNQLNSQYNPLNQTLGQGQSAANTAFQDPQALLSAYQNAQAASAGGSAYQGPQADPNQLANYNAFQGDVAGSNQYNQNQQQIQNYNTTGQQANNQAQTQLGTLAQSTGAGANEMGRNQLLQQTVGNPNYNQGQQTLDSLFLQGQGNQLQQNLQGIQKNTASTVNNANTDYQSKLNALQNLSGQNTQYANNLFLNGNGTAGSPQGLNQIGSNVQNEYNTLAGVNGAPGTAVQAQQALQSAANGGTQYTADQLASLGLTSGQQTWGLTGQQLLNSGAYSPNAVQAYNQGGAAQAATGDEFARYNALNQIAGGPTGTLQNNIFGSATQAGYNPYTVNQQALQAGIQGQEANVKKDFTTQVQDLANAISNQANTSGTGITWSQPIQNQLSTDSGQLASMLQSGKFDPALVQQIAQGFNTSLGPARGAQGSQFNNWYQNTYEPDATSTINGQAMTAPTASGVPGNGTPAAHTGGPASGQQTNEWNNLINAGFGSTVPSGNGFTT